MTLVADERERNESSVSSSNRFSFISSKETTYSTQDSSSYSPSSPSPPAQQNLFQQGHSSSASSSSSPHVAFSTDSGSSRPHSSDLAAIDLHHKGPSKLVKRNSLRLAKRISSSSLLPSNYSNKKKPFSEQDPAKRNVGGFFYSTIRPSVMLWKENIMARKGYWIRNVAILVFGLSLFFFVMLPRQQPNLHNRTTSKGYGYTNKHSLLPVTFRAPP